MRRVVTLALLGLLVAAAPAGAQLVPQQSLAGVRLGMTERKVRDVLGAPRRVVIQADEIQGSVRRLEFGLTTVFSDRASRRVFSVTTTSRRQRTADGVGVGSLRATVLRRVEGARCAGRVCSVGRLRIGETVTTFVLSGALRVKRVSLGSVID